VSPPGAPGGPDQPGEPDETDEPGGPAGAKRPGTRATIVPFGMIILAGGRATRLGGADKPGLVIGGRTLLAAVVAAGTEAGARRVVVVGPDRTGTTDARRAIRFVREQPPGSGPVPALRRGLAELAPRRGLAKQAPRRGLAEPDDATEQGAAEQGAAAEPWVAVLAADLPFLRAEHLRTLLAVAAAAGRDGAVLADDWGRAQWLAGCWRTGALRRGAAGYQGSSLHGLLAPLRPVSVSLPPGPGEPPPWLDCDTAQDLRRARDWQARSRRPAVP
jgi:molybdenum cofactor guanylyltransferase